MKHLLTGIFLLVTLAGGAKTTLPALDSIYHYYAEENYTRAAALLEQLRQQNSPRSSDSPSCWNWVITILTRVAITTTQNQFTNLCLPNTLNIHKHRPSSTAWR